MLYKYTEEELRSICKSSIDSLERWARIIMDRSLREEYGSEYFDFKFPDGNRLIKNSISVKATDMIKEHPERFARKIDTLFLEEIISIMCRQDLYDNFFKTALNDTYPCGYIQAKKTLESLVPIRNELSHGNSIAIRDAEKVICYSNDFIDGVKCFFEKEGMDKMFNVPNAIKLTDSLGNEYYLTNADCPEVIRVEDGSELRKFSVGEKYSIWATLDPSFPRETFTINWKINNKIQSNNEKVSFVFSEEMVATEFYLTFEIIQNKKWHKYNYLDQRVIVCMCVLPPMD